MSLIIRGEKSCSFRFLMIPLIYTDKTTFKRQNSLACSCKKQASQEMDGVVKRYDCEVKKS